MGKGIRSKVKRKFRDLRVKEQEAFLRKEKERVEHIQRQLEKAANSAPIVTEESAVNFASNMQKMEVDRKIDKMDTDGVSSATINKNSKSQRKKAIERRKIAQKNRKAMGKKKR